MTMLYPNLCYNEMCYKGTVLEMGAYFDLTNSIILSIGLTGHFST